MPRMRHPTLRIALVLGFPLLAGLCWPAHGDLIRNKTARGYPDIAGDLVGAQTYTFDPSSGTGTFRVVNSPQFIALGPTSNELLSVTPDQHGTLRQTLQLKLDQEGKLVETEDNRFQLFGSVVIGDQIYRGLLLEGKPTAFGARAQNGGALSTADVFDLNMIITGGELARTFGREAYFRVVPQSNSTFQGDFRTSFSGEKPMTNLRALPAAIPEPSVLVVLLSGISAFAAARWCRRMRSTRLGSSVKASSPGQDID